MTNNRRIVLKSNAVADNDELLKNKIIIVELQIVTCTKLINDLKNSNDYDRVKNKIEEISKSIQNIEQLCQNTNEKELIINISRLNAKYRNVQNLYLDTRFNLINENFDYQLKNIEGKITQVDTKIKKSEDNIKEKIEDFDFKTQESEKTIKEISNNMMINIAAVFLGISLVSSIVAGVGIIPKEFLMAYFMSGGLIVMFILGICAIFFRKFDKKSIAITILCVAYFIIFGYVINKSYKDYNKNKYQLPNIENILDNNSCSNNCNKRKC